jgi:hypothetical protein
MSTQINELWADKLEVRVWFDSDNNIYNVDVISNDLPDDADTLVAGYTDLKTGEEAEFLARAWIDGYKLGKNNNT